VCTCGAERDGTVEQGADQELTLDVPDRIGCGDRPALQNMTAAVERTCLAQNHTVLTYPLEYPEAVEDAQCIGLIKIPAPISRTGGAALEHVDRPAGPGQRNGSAQARNPTAANDGCPHSGSHETGRFCTRAERVQSASDTQKPEISVGTQGNERFRVGRSNSAKSHTRRARSAVPSTTTAHDNPMSRSRRTIWLAVSQARPPMLTVLAIPANNEECRRTGRELRRNKSFLIRIHTELGLSSETDLRRAREQKGRAVRTVPWEA